MKGCTFKRTLPSGRITWGYSIDAGKDENGKRVQIFKSGFKREREADDALREKLNEKAEGALVAPDPHTLSEFTLRWFSEYGPRRCSGKTLERYKQLAAYILPLVGSAKLKDLSALMLERALNQVKDAGGRKQTIKKVNGARTTITTVRPLSAMTVRHVAAVMRTILKKAVKLKLIRSSPMEGVELDAVPHREARALDSEAMNWFLEAARSYGIYEILVFAAGTGCRRGEALALTWSDVDLVHGAVRIAKSLEQTREGLRLKSTKTSRTRTISLPASLRELLKFHHERQAENRRLFGSDYKLDLNLVFAKPEGDYLAPNSVSSKACLIARKAGLGRGVSLHTLRHSHASQLLSGGASLPVVSKRLGHTSVTTTANVYAHMLPKDDLAAAEMWEAKFQSAVAQTGKVRIS